MTRGSYRGLLALFHMPLTDYKRFMNFLATHDCRVDYREFRNVTTEVRQSPRPMLPLSLTAEPCDTTPKEHALDRAAS